MSRSLIRLLFCLFSVLCFQACVPERKVNDIKAAREKCDSELKELQARFETYTAHEKELAVRVEELSKQAGKLSSDTSVTGVSLRRLTSAYDKLNETYDKLISNNKQLMEGQDQDNKKLMGQYQLTQEELQRKEDKLRRSEEDLEKRRTEIDKLSAGMKVAEDDLKAKELRVAELESVLAKKDSTMKALRTKVSDALLGFQDNGLTVSMKNGKVYVSLEERLLFASGSTVVDAKGVDAIKNLAAVLEKESEVNILIEGHTDNVPIKSATIKDNWDLSVLRATAIVRIITSGSKVDPKRLTAAGKGEYFPIDKANTPDARRKNRRTEIILTPKLDELFELINTN